MRSYRYVVVDVFTTEPLAGNALAVFPAASGLEAATMQKIAREMNLAETSFILPATRQDCAAHVRIFTPAKEMAFAGHPTVGTAFVMLQEKIVPQDSSVFVLEELIGPVPLVAGNAQIRAEVALDQLDAGAPAARFGVVAFVENSATGEVLQVADRAACP